MVDCWSNKARAPQEALEMQALSVYELSWLPDKFVILHCGKGGSSLSYRAQVIATAVLLPVSFV